MSINERVISANNKTSDILSPLFESVSVTVGAISSSNLVGVSVGVLTGDPVLPSQISPSTKLSNSLSRISSVLIISKVHSLAEHVHLAVRVVPTIEKQGWSVLIENILKAPSTVKTISSLLTSEDSCKIKLHVPTFRFLPSFKSSISLRHKIDLKSLSLNEFR